MAIIKGGSFRVKVDTKTIIHEADFTFGITSNMLDVANKDNPLDKIAGLKEFPISGTGYAGNSEASAQEDLNSLATWADAQTAKAIEIADGVAGNLAFTGTAYLSDFQITGAVNEAMSYTFTLTVTSGTVGTTAV